MTSSAPDGRESTRAPGWLVGAAARRPDAVALEVPGLSLTYSELEARAANAAGALAARGVRAGERVAIVLPPGVAFAETLHGCLRLGAVAAPVDPRLSSRERAAQTVGAATIVDTPLEPASGAGASECDDHRLDATAVVIHTSGSAGAPRPVELTYGNFEASARGSAERLGTDPGERWLSTLPLSHVGGLSILVRSAIHASAAIVHERFDARAVAAALERDAITLVSLVPTTLGRLLDAGSIRARALRCALIGGGPLPQALAERAADAGLPLAQTYGLTEACSQVTTSAIGDPSTAGRPLQGTTVEIADDGEILVAGPTVAPGAAGADGLLHTGDLGSLDNDGRLTVTGRKAETIVTGGENVAPAEVEAVLLAHPAVAEAAVHGRPDAEWGETVVATVVLAPGRNAEPGELRQHCAAELASFKVPKTVEIATALARTQSGKLRRDALR